MRLKKHGKCQKEFIGPSGSSRGVTIRDMTIQYGIVLCNVFLKCCTPGMVASGLDGLA